MLISPRYLPFVAALASAPLATRTLPAQGAPLDARCTSTLPVTTTGYAAALVQQDACQKSIDLFNFLAPQLGALVAAGSAELGHGGTLGGLGHLDVSLRANVIGGGRLPDASNVQLSATGANRTDFRINSQTLALPAADAGIGLFAGVPVGLTRIGGIDLLVSASYVPSFTSGQVRVDRTGSALQLGYGARLGILERSRFVPGIGVTYLRREIPGTTILATTSDGGQIGVTGARVSTDSWRLAADQRVSIIGLSAGVGQDRYDASATVAGTASIASLVGTGSQTFTFTQAFAQRLTRTNVYAGIALPASGLAQLVAEVGRSSGGAAIATYNTFSGRTPTDALTYLSIGLRVGR